MHLLLQTSLERVKSTINSRLGVHIYNKMPIVYKKYTASLLQFKFPHPLRASR